MIVLFTYEVMRPWDSPDAEPVEMELRAAVERLGDGDYAVTFLDQRTDDFDQLEQIGAREAAESAYDTACVGLAVRDTVPCPPIKEAV